MRDVRASPGRRTSRWYHDPFVRWTSGLRRFRKAIDGRAVEDLYAERGRGRDLRALARRGRLRARRRRFDGRSGPAAVHDHPAAAERHRLAAPGPRAADRGRGPDDPARPDARASGTLPARARPREHRRPVRPRRDPRQGGREPPVARSRALPRADARVQRLDQARSCSGSSAGSAAPSTGAGCATRWTRARPGPCGSPSTGSTGTGSRTAPRRWSTGARVAGPASATSRSISTPETGTLWSVRYHLIDDATGAPDPAATITVATTRPETILGDTAVAVHPDDPRYAPLVGRTVRIPFVERDVPVIADAVVDPAFGTGRRQDHPGPRPRRPCDRTPPRPRGHHGPRRRRDDHRHGHALRRPRSLRGPAADRRRPRGARATWSDRGPHEMVIGRCQRSDDVIEPRLKTQWFIRTGPLAARALDATRSGRTRILPEQFEKTWEHWLTEIRDWNVSRQLWWGHRIPAWYCPDGHVTVSTADGRSGCLRGLRPPGRRPGPGPRHLRHLVQLGAVAVLDPRLARRHAGLPPVLPDVGDGDRLRHHLLLGRPDDDARPVPDRPGAVPHRLPVRPDPRPDRPEDVEDQRQRRRPARRHRRVGRRRPALRAHPRRDARQRPALRCRPSSRTPGTSPTSSGTRRASSSVRGPTTIPDGAERRLPDAARLGPAERWLLSRAAATTEAVDAAMAGLRVRRGHAPRSTWRSGASTATGAWSWPRSASATGRSTRPSARRPGGRWSRSSTSTCGCSTRSCRS